MDLSEWIKKDMVSYIKDHEDKKDNGDPVRPEDSAQILQIDYLKRIDRNLESGRFSEAQRLFNQLKTRFHDIPENHVEERKHIYQILQKSYRHIYDFVEDKHKTQKILQQAQVIVDVFDSNAPADEQHSTDEITAKMPVNMRKSGTDGAQHIQIRHHNTAPPPMSQGSSIGNTFVPQPAPTQIVMAPPQVQVVQLKEEPKTAREYLAYLKTRDPHPAPVKRSTTTVPKRQLPPEPKEVHLPKFEPPKLREEIKQTISPVHAKLKKAFTDSNEQHEQNAQPITATKPILSEQPLTVRTPTINSKEIVPAENGRPSQASSHPATEDLKHAKHHLHRGELQDVQQYVLRARKKLKQEPHSALEKEAQHIERSVGIQVAKAVKTPDDGELFSNLYLKGISALNNLDYQSAARYFQQRVQQAPRDRAAKIRLQETLEAMNGTNA